MFYSSCVCANAPQKTTFEGPEQVLNKSIVLHFAYLFQSKENVT